MFPIDAAVQDPSTLISSIQAAEVAPLVANGTINSDDPKPIAPLKPSIAASIAFILSTATVSRTTLEIFTDKGVGTEIVNA